MLRSLRPDGSGRSEDKHGGGATSRGEADQSRVCPPTLKNCARVTWTTKVRSSSPAPQALRLGRVRDLGGGEGEGDGPVRERVSWDGVDRCGMRPTGGGSVARTAWHGTAATCVALREHSAPRRPVPRPSFPHRSVSLSFSSPRSLTLPSRRACGAGEELRSFVVFVIRAQFFKVGGQTRDWSAAPCDVTPPPCLSADRPDPQAATRGAPANRLRASTSTSTHNATIQ